jgi:uncharacterized protein (DUF1697 family)
MHTWIVLIRGINVGGRVLLMKRLVELMEKAGCSDVRTYIQSGNVVCKSRVADGYALGTKIGKAILASEGYEPRVMVLSRTAFDAAVVANPYPVTVPKLVHLFFLSATPTSESMAAVEALRLPSEKYTLDKTTFYFYAPDGFGTSMLAAKFEKVSKVDATARNWNTVQALHGLAAYDTSDAKRAAGTARRVRKPAATGASQKRGR